MWSTRLLFVQLFFPIVREQHWVVKCINIFLKQINFFNSINASTITPCYEASNNLVITSCPFFISHDICFPFLAFACCNHHSFVLLRLQTFQRLYWNWKFLKRMCPSLSPSILQTTRTNIHCMFLCPSTYYSHETWLLFFPHDHINNIYFFKRMIVVSTLCCTWNPGMGRRWMFYLTQYFFFPFSPTILTC